jgi:hypothetical protein
MGQTQKAVLVAILAIAGSFGACAVSVAAAVKESMGFGHCATLAPLKGAPTLDGTLAPGEWDGAVRTVNFLSLSHRMLEPRLGTTYCGFTNDRLYIAVISELPPKPAKGPYSNASKRDAEVIWDFNALEIWLDPNRDRRESGDGDQSFYQLFVNTLGNTADLRVIPGKAPDSGWNPEVQSGHSLDTKHKIWTAELSIPFTDLGWAPGTALGRSLGLLIARNYKAPWCQVTWFPHKDAFVSWQFYPRIYLTTDEPSVAIESLGDELFQAMPSIKLKLFNPGPARTAKVKVHITSSDMPDLKDEKDLALPANGVGTYDFTVLKELLHVAADHKVTIRVEAADGARTWFDYAAGWSATPMVTIGWDTYRRPVTRKWDIRLEANPNDALSFSAYPSYGLVRGSLNAGALVADPDEEEKAKVSDSAVVTLTAADGKELARTEVTWDRAKDQRGGAFEFKLAEIPEGVNTVTAVFKKQPAQPIAQKYTRKKYAFEGNTLGISERIHAPFTPGVVKKQTVSVVGRTYAADGLGFWKSIVSLDKELLAAPMLLTADGTRVLTGKGKFTAAKPLAAVYEGQAKDPAVTVKTRCTTEIDGCMKVELTLLLGTKGAPLTALALEIPLKDALMPLWHATA